MPDTKQPCIAIAMPVRDLVHADTHRSVMALDIPRPFHVLDVRDHPVDVARNEIVGRAFSVNDSIAKGANMPSITHMLWVDDDMVFAPSALKQLLAHDLPVVGGLCHNRRAPYMPILLYKAPPAAGRKYLYRYDYPRGLVEVDATGAAFLLIKMEVFEAIEKKFPQVGEGPFSNLGSGEDVSFCERAKACGYSIFVDTSLEIGHVGEVVVDSEFGRRNRGSEVNPWIPEVKMRAPGVPVATIIIPTFNQEPALLRAALVSALAQTVPVEILLIDNASTGSFKEEVWALAEEYRTSVKLIENPTNLGLWRSLNRALEEMSTDYVTILSSDDILYPKKVERQLRVMQSLGAQASFHGYDVRTPDGSGVIVPAPSWRTMEEQQRLLSRACCINMLTWMLHVNVFKEVGNFDASYEISSDWEFENRVAQRFFWQPITEILATRRDHPGSASTRFAADPERAAKWQSEDAAIRLKYAPRCPHCKELMP